ncbi:MAG: 3-isopropylmalate dehydratase small subunit [Actinobacteria bacterium]|nr:3-isopropylmalate dehydratase small subunit [Actinomycetota bacterium]
MPASPQIITAISGHAISIEGNDIDTDRIIPARFLKEITFDKMGEYLFYDARFNEQNQPLSHPLNTPIAKNATILVVDDNFGCGSSREHAPQAIKRFGFDAVIGHSFAEIFAGNCKAIGIPVIQASHEALAKIRAQLQKNPSTQFNINLVSKRVSFFEESILIQIPNEHRDAFLDGTWDILSVLQSKQELAQKIDQALPYLKP